MVSRLAYLSIATVKFLAVSAALYNKASQLPASKFDYVIVGGGTAGNVLANRLTENPKISVLVIEAGPTNKGVLEIEVPYLAFTATPNTPWDWNLTTVPQTEAHNREIPYHQGHVLGGASSVNGMLYTRSSAGDYDRLAKLTGDPGWGWDTMLGYIKKSESIQSPSGGRDVSDEFNPAFHGTTGPLGTTLPGFTYSIDPIVVESANQLGGEWKFEQDYNTGTPLGMAWTQSTIFNGSRVSSATAFLADKYLARKNLNVLVEAFVTTVSASSSNGTINTVSFTQNGKVSKVTAGREVIISAGFARTPQLLINSGIGDATALKALNITLVKDIPSVGKNLSDHILIQPSFDRNATDLVTNFMANATILAQSIAEWKATHAGPLANGLTNQLGYLRLNESEPDIKAIFDQFGDPSPSPQSPHLQIGPFNSGPLSFSIALVTPYSRGSVTVDPSNRFGAPFIDLGFLTAPQDVTLLRHAFSKVIELVSAPALKSTVIGPNGGTATVVASDTGNGFDTDVLDNFIRDTVFPIYHAVGTAAMTAKDASYGVVDPDLRVKGVKGLRVVDASIFPYIPTANTQAPTYAIAERAADLIKQSQSTTY